MGYYSATERNEVHVPATTWMNLENIILSETDQILYEYTYMKSLEQANS